MVRRGRRRGLDIPASHDEDRENENVSDSQKTDVRKDKGEDDECNRRPLNSCGGRSSNH